MVAVMRQRLAAGEQVTAMYQEPGLAWLERQAEVAEDAGDTVTGCESIPPAA